MKGFVYTNWQKHTHFSANCVPFVPSSHESTAAFPRATAREVSSRNAIEPRKEGTLPLRRLLPCPRLLPRSPPPKRLPRRRLLPCHIYANSMPAAALQLELTRAGTRLADDPTAGAVGLSCSCDASKPKLLCDSSHYSHRVVPWSTERSCRRAAQTVDATVCIVQHSCCPMLDCCIKLRGAEKAGQGMRWFDKEHEHA
jgi:hypothetical protein